MLPTYIAGVTCLWIGAREVEKTNDMFNPFILGFVLSAAVGLGMEGVVSRLFRCEKCEAYLGNPRMAGPVERQEYVYDCTHCQITWHTNFFVSKD